METGRLPEVLVVPSIDVERGRSRVVFWPGAASGVGAPTDRPDIIAARFVELGAALIHLVDFDGARAGNPGNLEAVGAVASRVAVPLQLAGGIDGPDQVRLAFAAGATRVVAGMAIVDQPDVLRECVEVAGDWLAVGLDPRPERLAAFPWHRPAPPTMSELASELVGQGVRRLVLSHGGSAPHADAVGPLVREHDLEVFVAGGVTDVDGVRRLRDTGIAGIIVGEALLSGALDFAAASEAAA
jgi:phosphoribosylformimino-5-aminoimidazole carboxamide ribotide isomerase